MRCAVCGKEFGTENNCQHCGSDKFTGLGNYCGYNAPVGNGNTPIQAEGIDNQSTNYLLQTENVGVIACYACGEIIPADSKFCPYCSKELFVTCPQCGHKYSSQFPACNMCGTNRGKYIEIETMKKNGKLFEIPYGTVSISANQFKKSSYEYIIIPSTVTSINESAFEGCKQIKQIVIPGSVFKIGDCAFYECESLKEIVIPSTVHSIGKRAFAYCQSLQKVNLPHIQDVEDSSFFRCDSLKKIVIPNTVKQICNDAFWGCRSLRKIEIPDSVCSIGADAFGECVSLEEVVLPKSLKTTINKVFNGCDNLKVHKKGN